VERPEHQLHHRADAQHGGADPHADEPGFGNRGVDHALVAPLFPQAFGHLVGTVVLGDFLAHDDDVPVAGQFFIEAFSKGLTVGECAGHVLVKGGMPKLLRV
jgi:hypothetical protein